MQVLMHKDHVMILYDMYTICDNYTDINFFAEDNDERSASSAGHGGDSATFWIAMPIM